eukprot:6492611-Amphidinium_carterae.4
MRPPISSPRVLEIFTLEADIVAACKPFDVDAIAFGACRHKRSSKAPVFPFEPSAGRRSQVCKLLQTYTTGAIFVHVPLHRSTQWHSFLLLVLELVLQRGIVCIWIVVPIDGFLDELTSSLHVSGSPYRVVKSSAGFDVASPNRSFFTRVLVGVNALIELPGFVTIPATSKQLPLECAKGRLPQPWIAALVESVLTVLNVGPKSTTLSALARMGAQSQSKRSVRAALVSEYSHVVTVAAGAGWQVRNGVTLDSGSGRVLELRVQAGGSMEAQQQVAKVGIWRSPVEFLLEACTVVHPFDSFDSVPDNVRKGIFERLEKGKQSFTSGQLRALHWWKKRHLELENDERKFKDGLATSVKAVLGPKPLLLFGEMCSDAGWEDATLVKDIADGFPLVGDLRDTGLFQARTRPAQIDEVQLREQSTWIRRSSVGSCRSSGDHDLDCKLWASVEKDIDNGWAIGPFFTEADVTEALGVGDWVVSKRFPVVQGSKVRGVDDFSASLVNSTVSSFQKIIPGSADNVAALISFFSVHAAHKEIVIPLSDGTVLRGSRHQDFEDE